MSTVILQAKSRLIWKNQTNKKAKLSTERALVGRTLKVKGRGRPRRMYQVSQERFDKAQKLAEDWSDSVTQQPQMFKAAAI
ncbi:hypothetical protein B7486_51480 [cyanobacterium TDX16]|nr:hypothetical protein B7486_51480 [cyanobacterium TDX16]